MDSLVLYGPGGASPVNLGSWLRADVGVDFGARGLIHAIESESFADGGAYAYERAGIRKMSVPLVLASGGAGLGLTSLESLLRLNARPGGYLDVQVEGAASAEAVRFDLVHGRWEPEYSVYHQRVSRRVGALMLDTQPFGYWPTWITLASAASMMSPGRLPLKAASVIGDVPAFARLVISPDEQGVIASGGAGSVYRADYLAWSIGGGGSIPTFIPAASFIVDYQGASYRSDAFASNIAGGPTVLRFTFIPGGSARAFGMNSGVVDAHTYLLDNKYQGRHRVYGWFRPFCGSGNALSVSLDINGKFYNGPLASANAVATLIDAASQPYSYANASGIGYPYQLVDFGEYTIPDPAEQAISFPSYSMQARLWFRVPSTAASPIVDFAGIFLLPVDGPAGYVPRDLMQPSAGAITMQSALGLDSYARAVNLRNQAFASGFIYDAVEGYPGRRAYIGGLPYLGASDTNLNVVIEDRRYQDTTSPTWALPLVRGFNTAAKVTVEYRPRFTFLKGL